MYRKKVLVWTLFLLFSAVNVLAGLARQAAEFPKAAFGQDDTAALSILYSGETRGNIGTCG
jgi:hypothetical protein